jgi:hypothetical protein
MKAAVWRGPFDLEGLVDAFENGMIKEQRDG